jgi:uncharacterized protein (DUF736 family)
MARPPEIGKGALNKNDRATSDKAPQWRGMVTDPTGKTWELSGWLRSGSYGEFISLSIKEPYVAQTGGGGSDYQPREETRQRASVGHTEPFDDSEVPF